MKGGNMFYMNDGFFIESKEERRARLREERLFHIRNLIKKFIKSRKKDDFLEMRKAGFHLIPLLNDYTADEVRSLFREIEKEVS